MPESSAALKQLHERCAPHLATLRRSAMFAMSRGAKELFHTNFLAFVLELDEEAVDVSDRDRIRKVRRALLARIFGTDAPEHVLAWREAQSLDLVLAASPGTNEDGHPILGSRVVLNGPPRKPQPPPKVTAEPPCLAVIEAKLKALPDVEQLRRYDDVLRGGLSLTLDPDMPAKSADGPSWGRLDITTTETGNGTALLKAYPPEAGHEASDGGGKQRCIASGYGNVRRLLLAPNDSSGAAARANWAFIDWLDLLGDLESGGVETGGRLADMLDDYAMSTKALLTILHEVDALVSQTYVPSCAPLTLADVHAASSRFKSIRIHDVVGKRSYSALLLALRQSLEQQDLKQTVGDWRLEAEVFMSRGTPGICIEYRLSDGAKRGLRHVSLGVQIQGTAFRRYLSASHPSEAAAEHPLLDLAEQRKR